MKLTSLFLAFGTLFGAGVGLDAVADTVHVPGDQPTIQAGIDVANIGDTVLVAPGTYFEHLLISKDIRVISEAGWQSTIIDGGGSGTVVQFVGALTESARLTGFTARRGMGGAIGGGITTSSGEPSPTISDCRVEDISSLGVLFLGGSPVFENNVVSDCGWGIRAQGSGAILHHNFIVDNASDGLTVYVNEFGPTMSVSHNVIARNGGDGITGFVNSPSALLYVGNNTIVDNGGDGVDLDVYTLTLIERNIVASNDGWGLLNGAFFPNPIYASLTCNDVWNNGTGSYSEMDPGLNDFSMDPLFCDFDSGNYFLQAFSPCAPPGVTGCGLVGTLDVGCGGVSVSPTSWGKLKTIYR